MRLEKWGIERVTPEIIEHAKRIVLTSPDEITLPHILAGWALEHVHLWVALDEDKVKLAMFVELCHYHATKFPFVRVMGIAGEGVQEALGLLEKIEQWAKTQGARKISVKGRRGWEAVLRPQGYAFEAVTMSKPLGDDNV